MHFNVPFYVNTYINLYLIRSILNPPASPSYRIAYLSLHIYICMIIHI